jgi:hypothetical protein
VRVEDVATPAVRYLLAETDRDLIRRRLLGRAMYPRHGCVGLGTGVEVSVEAVEALRPMHSQVTRMGNFCLIIGSLEQHQNTGDSNFELINLMLDDR